MFRLDFGDHRPLYEQIKDKIKELIISGALKEGDMLASTRIRLLRQDRKTLPLPNNN